MTDEAKSTVGVGGGRRVARWLRRHVRFVAFCGAALCVWGVSAVEVEEEPGWVMQAIMDFFTWLICFLLDLAWPVFDYLFGLMPFGDLESWGEAGQFTGAVNTWISLDYALAIAGVMATYLLLFVVVRSVIKFIPGIG